MFPVCGDTRHLIFNKVSEWPMNFLWSHIVWSKCFVVVVVNVILSTRCYGVLCSTTYNVTISKLVQLNKSIRVKDINYMM